MFVVIVKATQEVLYSHYDKTECSWFIVDTLEETDTPYKAGDLDVIPVACQWFARCENEATTTRDHPILGAVPICDRCNDKITSIDSTTGNRK